MERFDRNKAERELIAYTIGDLRDSIGELESRIEMMTEDLQGKKDRLETWRRKLAALSNGNPSAKRRRPKGENLRHVITCLQNVTTGLASSEIQRRTELPWSSIQATLKRHPDLFVEAEGLWRLCSQNGRIRLTASSSLDDIVSESDSDEEAIFEEDENEESDPDGGENN